MNSISLSEVSRSILRMCCPLPACPCPHPPDSASDSHPHPTSYPRRFGRYQVSISKTEGPNFHHSDDQALIPHSSSWIYKNPTRRSSTQIGGQCQEPHPEPEPHPKPKPHLQLPTLKIPFNHCLAARRHSATARTCGLCHWSLCHQIARLTQSVREEIGGVQTVGSRGQACFFKETWDHSP